MEPRIVAICPVRSEDWILGMSLRALLLWVDHVVVLLHACTDGSQAIVYEVEKEYPSKITILIRNESVWEEMDHRQALLEEARRQGATHVVTVDADEILTANLLPTIKQFVLDTPPGMVLQIPWIQLRGSINTFHSHGMWAQQDVSIAFKDESRCHWAARDGYHFHQRAPMGRDEVPYKPLGPAFLGPGRGGLLHLQMVVDRRLRAKQAWYLCCNEVLRWLGRKTPEELNAQYGPSVYGGPKGEDVTLAQTPASWWVGYENLLPHLNLSPDAEPWQERAVRDIVKEHGREKFVGLDLFGVA